VILKILLEDYTEDNKKITIKQTLKKNRRRENMKKTKTQELQKHIANKKLEELTQRNFSIDEKASAALEECNYKKLTTNTGIPIYARANQDQTVDIVTFANLEELKVNEQKPGFTHIKLDGLDDVSEYKKALLNFVRMGENKTKEGYNFNKKLAYLITLGIGAALGATIAKLTGIDFTALNATMSCVGGSTALLPAGYFFGKYIQREYKLDCIEAVTELTKFKTAYNTSHGTKPSYGAKALENALQTD
jgi:hypothetical protein